MKNKRVTLTEEERIALQTMVYLEIKSIREAEEIEEMDIEPVFDAEMLKTLYQKLARLWKED